MRENVLSHFLSFLCSSNFYILYVLKKKKILKITYTIICNPKYPFVIFLIEYDVVCLLIYVFLLIILILFCHFSHTLFQKQKIWSYVTLHYPDQFHSQIGSKQQKIIFPFPFFLFLVEVFIFLCIHVFFFFFVLSLIHTTHDTRSLTDQCQLHKIIIFCLFFFLILFITNMYFSC